MVLSFLECKVRALILNVLCISKGHAENVFAYSVFSYSVSEYETTISLTHTRWYDDSFKPVK